MKKTIVCVNNIFTMFDFMNINFNKDTVGGTLIKVKCIKIFIAVVFCQWLYINKEY